MEDRVTLNQAEQRRLLVLNHLEAGALFNAEAAELLGISIRQVRRLRAAYRERGAAALAHGNRGRRPGPCHRSQRGRAGGGIDNEYLFGLPPCTSPRCSLSTKALPCRGRACIASWPPPGSHRCASGARRAIVVAVTACRGQACSSRSPPAGMTGWRGVGPG